MHRYAKLTVAAWTAASLFIPRLSSAQPDGDDPSAVINGERRDVAEVRFFVNSSSNAKFDRELVGALDARLRGAGFVLTTATSPGVNLENSGNTGGRADFDAYARFVMSTLRPSPEAVMAVIVRVEAERCRVALLDVGAQTVSVRELPRGNNDDVLAEEIISVVVSAAAGVGAPKRSHLAPASRDSAAEGTHGASSVAPIAPAHRASGQSAAPTSDANRATGAMASEHGRLVPSVRGGVHLQTAGGSAFSLGPRLQLGINPFADPAWFVTASAAYHPARTIRSEEGHFELSRSFLDLGVGHEWRSSDALRTSVSLAAVAGHVERDATRPAPGSEAAASSRFWRWGGEFATLLEASSESGVTLGVNLALGVWSRALRFASARGPTLFAEQSIFASGTVYVGYRFDD